MTHHNVSHNTQWWTYVQPLTISVRSFIIVYALIAKSIRSTRGHYEDNSLIIPATWEWDKLLNTTSNIQQSTLRSWGGRTLDHSLVVCSPDTIQWIIQDICKRDLNWFPAFTVGLMLNHIQCNLTEQGMAVCVQRTMAIKLLLIYYTSW